MHRGTYTTFLGMIVLITTMSFLPVYFVKEDMKSKLIGKRAFIKEGFYEGHWGVIKDYDGDTYTITEGSIGDLKPIFDRDEFIIRREKK
jgi:hypothetical protein